MRHALPGLPSHESRSDLSGQLLEGREPQLLDSFLWKVTSNWLLSQPGSRIVSLLPHGPDCIRSSLLEGHHRQDWILFSRLRTR